MNRQQTLETGGGRYCLVNATIHFGWNQLSDEDKIEFPLSDHATHGNINYIGQQMLKNWSNSRYSSSASVSYNFILCVDTTLFKN